ncbi:MAG: hypothetical protein QNJ04_04685 [Desulfobacterales bacterium]|nr:hypothetical protein [Desulfobacterales bacterium]
MKAVPERRIDTMANQLMSGFWRLMLSVPPFLWEAQVAKARHKIQRGMGFMSPEHRSVHHFSVRELPRFGRPLPPERIADRLGLTVSRVVTLLDDLEARMTFLFRNPSGEVTWAYPVTVETTPHAMTFSTGERLHAA